MWGVRFLVPASEDEKEGCFFKDRRRRADFVIVPAGLSLDPLFTYIRNLEQKGLELEAVEGQTVPRKFILIHLPPKANKYFAEAYNVGLEEHKTDVIIKRPIWFCKVQATPISSIPFKERGEFTSAERIIIINQILEETEYGNEIGETGITRLIKIGKVETAYPLHDGFFHKDLLAYSNDRQLLFHYWSKLRYWYKEMPIDMLQKYFGCEIAFYFAWLEYFNYLLVPAAFIGTLVTAVNYILVTWTNIPEVSEICNEHNVWICPTCRFGKHCTFRKLSSYCWYAQNNYMFDNYRSVAFAIFMSFWATYFVHWWRREENKLKLRWDVQYQNPILYIRYEYLLAATKTKLNRITGRLEPYVSKHIRYLKMAFSVTVCIFMMVLIFGAVCGLIVLKLIIRMQMETGPIRYFRKKYLGSILIIGSILNVIFIKMISKVYDPMIIWLTNFENQRTQYDYDKSYLYKKYILSFVNDYMALFYFAFLRGRLYTLPNRMTHATFLERDTCQPLNCVFIIVIIMGFLLILKQFAIHVVKIVIHNCKNGIRKLIGKRDETSYAEIPQYEVDYKLKALTRFAMTCDFNSKVISYGHATLFVAAFPMAPLLILLNNILDVRMQAHKLIAHSRRPIPRRKEGIGAWNGIMAGLTYFSKVTNAFVIAWTSSFIEREIYRHTMNYDLKGYINSTLSKFDTRDYQIDFASAGHIDPKICYYKALRHSPDHRKRYEFTSNYWIEVSWKLVFALIFEHMILLCGVIFGYMIPKIPRSVKVQLKMDKKLTKEAKDKYLLGLWPWQRKKSEVRMRPEADSLFRY